MGQVPGEDRAPKPCKADWVFCCYLGPTCRHLPSVPTNRTLCAGSTCLLQVGIAEGAVRLERSKDMFREKVKAMLEAFLREVAVMQEDFTRLQPNTKDGVSSTTALAFIAKWKGAVSTAHQKVHVPSCGGGCSAWRQVVGRARAEHKSRGVEHATAPRFLQMGCSGCANPHICCLPSTAGC